MTTLTTRTFIFLLAGCGALVQSAAALDYSDLRDSVDQDRSARYEKFRNFQIRGICGTTRRDLAVSAQAIGSAISVNFSLLGGQDQNKVDAGETSVSGITGAVSVDGSLWNNIVIGTAGIGEPTSFTAATQGGSHIDLTDSSGADSGVDLTSSGSFYANWGDVSTPNQAAYFASRGMVAICPEYRTGKGHGTTPREWVKDTKSAMRWAATSGGTMKTGNDAKNKMKTAGCIN